jgi:predicted thioesterase
MAQIELGLKGSEKMLVKRQDLASFTGNIGAEVLSTHRLVLLLEQAARNAIEARLPDGKITVGTMIRIKHFAATPVGAKVHAEAVLKEIQGCKLVFDVAAYDEFEKLSEGENERYIVSVAKFLERVKKKQLDHNR